MPAHDPDRVLVASMVSSASRVVTRIASCYDTCMKRGGLLLTSGAVALAAASTTAATLGWRAIGPADQEPGMVAWFATVIPWVVDFGQEVTT